MNETATRSDSPLRRVLQAWVIAGMLAAGAHLATSRQAHGAQVPVASEKLTVQVVGNPP